MHPSNNRHTNGTFCDELVIVMFLDYFMCIHQDKSVGVVNASPISMGLLSNRGPPSWHPATVEIRKNKILNTRSFYEKLLVANETEIDKYPVNNNANSIHWYYYVLKATSLSQRKKMGSLI